MQDKAGCSADCNGVQTGKPANRYCCGDASCETSETIGNCAVDCTPPSPGEAGAPDLGMMQLGYDRASDVITVTCGAACSAEDHALPCGEPTRPNLETYTWSGRECAIGATGSFDWFQSDMPLSTFFVIVGTTATAEGSYGRDAFGSERPEDDSPADCQVPQDLVFRCD